MTSNCDLIESLALRDDVTFVRYDSYAVIHAWDRARLVEYLTVCLAYCRGNTPAI